MILNKRHIIAMAIVGLLTVNPVFANKPDHAGGNGKNGSSHGQSSHKGPSAKNDNKKPKAKESETRKYREKGNHAHRVTDSQRNWNRDRPRDNKVSINVRFSDTQRAYIHNHYRDQFRRGSCPPGLAKKNNGCMPPGHAKKWRKGYPLARDVVYYDLPPSIIVQLGRPPSGYRYVRVAADILIIAVGSGLVMDAVADLVYR